VKKRCIMIFPKFDNSHVIDALRLKYDPLVHHVSPHLTLVFPFESDLDTQTLSEHLASSLQSIEPFQLRLQGISRGEGYGFYLHLNVQEGQDELIELHEKLYGGVLDVYRPSWLRSSGYTPHLTVGNFKNESDLIDALDQTKDTLDLFVTKVNLVSVEIIDEDENSLIELEHPLALK
jgi:2'-5' RNA ligase